MAVSRSTAGAARPVLVNGTASRLAGKRVGSLSGIHGDAAKASNNIVRIPQPGGAASGLNGLRQLLAPIPGQGSTAVRALHGIVPFVRSVGVPLPSAAEAAGVGANLLRFAGSLGTGVVTGLLLGGDAPQRQPGQQLLQRLAQSRANLDQTFEALGGLVTETTGSFDFNGRRAALTSMLATSRQQIQTIAAAQPEKAARELAAVFKRFELRNAGGAGADDQARLAVARDILKRSVWARPATPLRPPAMAARPASTPVSGPVSKIAAPLPQPAARGRHAVQALGEAFRAYKTEPTTNRRADLNDVLARARSLKARDGRQWTPDTLRSYASYVRRAARALYGPSDRTGAPPARLPALGTPSTPAHRRSSLPDRQALVTHTGRVGTPEQIATRQLEATARDLREAAAIYHRRKKTLLAGGDAAALAKEVYDGTRLRMFGVSLAQFEAHLQAGQEQEGASGARVKAGAGAGAGGLRLKTLSVGLLNAWNGGALVDSRDPALQLSSVEEAEALQTAVLAGLQAGDSRATAWKAGATSKEARVSVAPLPTRGVLQGQQAQLLTGPGEALALEAEIAYLLERPVTTLPNQSDTMSYFSGMFPAMEVIGSRLFEGLDAPELLRLADLQSHRALVLGPWLPLRQIDGNSLQCKVMIDGRIVRDSAGGHACGDPAWVLHGWMQAVLARGGTLEAGDVVTTGSWGGMFSVPTGAGQAVVGFDGLGEVRLNLPRE